MCKSLREEDLNERAGNMTTASHIECYMLYRLYAPTFDYQLIRPDAGKSL